MKNLIGNNKNIIIQSKAFFYIRKGEISHRKNEKDIG